MKSLSLSNRIITGTMVALGTLYGAPPQAMPSDRAALSLPKSFYSALNADAALRGVSILGDHDPETKVLYVSPATKITKGGDFNDAGFHDCRSLSQQYKLSYYLPGANMENEDERSDFLFNIAKDHNEVVSPYFFIHFAGAVRNTALLSDLERYARESLELERGPFKEQYAAYQVAQEQYKLLMEREASVKDHLDALDRAIELIYRRMDLTTDPQALLALKEELVQAHEYKRTHYRERYSAHAAAVEKTDAARTQYLNAKQAVGGLLVDLEELKKRRLFYEELYAAKFKAYENAYNTSLNTLRFMENKTVGTVNFSLEIWNEEVARVAALIREHAPEYAAYNVVALPLHGVTMNQLPWSSQTKAMDGVQNEDQVLAKNENVPMPGQETEVVEDPSTQTDDGGKVSFVISKPVQSAVAIQQPISAGAYCMGENRGTEKVVSIRSDDDRMNGELSYYEYKQRQTPMIKQHLVINYSYFLKAEPWSVRCQLKTHDFLNHISKSGSSGFLFWRKNWTQDEVNVTQNNGLACDLKLRDSGLPLDQQLKWANDVKESFMRDIAAETILQNAKEWTVEKASSAKLPEKNEAFAHTGSSVRLLCAGNPYCLVGSIVWSSADELFFSRKANNSSSSTRDTAITRSLTVDGFKPAFGSLSVLVEVARP